MSHLILLGDSIFDNAAYVAPREAVIDHLNAQLAGAAKTTLLARDGAIVNGVHSQLVGIPNDATHLFISAGGNDALGHIGMLNEPARSMAAALNRLAGIGDEFEADYVALIKAVAKFDLPTTLCTIYNGRLQDPTVARLARTALSIFNDVIVRAAFAHEMDVIELRQVCNTPADYANDIEPSSRGGARIAGAIVEAFSRRAAAGSEQA